MNKKRFFIHTAMLASMMLFLVIAVMLKKNEIVANLFEVNTHYFLLALSILSSMISLFIGDRLYKKRTANITNILSDSDESKITSAYIIKAACIEMPIMLSIILFILSGYKPLIIVATVMIFIFLKSRPK